LVAALAHQMLVALTLVTVVVTVCSLGGMFWQWRQAEEQRRQAQEQRLQAEAARQEAQDQAQMANEALAHIETQLYVHCITLADREWWANPIARMEEMLERGPPALRHWEWHYLRRLCHSSLWAVRAPHRPVLAVAVAPDGKTLASGSDDCTIRLWHDGGG